MRARITGLVQLRTGDAIRGVVSRLVWPFRYIRVDTAEAYSAANPDAAPTKIDGVVWIPKVNVSFVQELTAMPNVNIEVPVKVKAPVTVLSPGGRAIDDDDEGE